MRALVEKPSSRVQSSFLEADRSSARFSSFSMNRLESMNSQDSEGMMFPHGAPNRCPRRDIQPALGPRAQGAAQQRGLGAGRTAARQGPTPAGVPSTDNVTHTHGLSSGTKRRRAHAVKRSLAGMFDAVETVDDVLGLKTPSPVAALVPRPVGGGMESGLPSLSSLSSLPNSSAGVSGTGCVGDAFAGAAHRRGYCHGNRVSDGHRGGKTAAMLSDDMSNASALTVENISANNPLQSTSQIVESCGGHKLRGGGGARGNPRDQSVALLELLRDTDRGSSLSLSEAKALVYSLAKDFCEIHATRGVHTNVCLESTVLDIVDGEGRAIMLKEDDGGLCAHPAAEVVAGKVAVSVHKHTMPPEMAHCRQNVMHRLTTKNGNMWSLGCIMFALLAGGLDPFGSQGVGVCGGATLLLSVDRQQSWLSSFLSDRMRRINESKAGGATVGDESLGEADHVSCGGDGRGMRGTRVFAVGYSMVGFDSFASDLLTRLLCVDPGQRLSAKEVLSHPWFDAVRNRLPRETMTALQGNSGQSREDDDLGNTRRSSGSENGHSVSEEQEQSERSDLKYSALHQKFIFIDPSVLSPMHPYTLIGHVKKEIEFASLGETYAGIGVYAVYSVPHHGTMMSAKPIKVLPH